MNCRIKLFPITAVAAVLIAVSLPAVAAMPVMGAAKLQADSVSMLAQDQTGGQKMAKKKSARKSEVDQSVESGTVPKRYRGSVPKQYHHLIPFAK